MKTTIKQGIINGLKGAAIGTANVIPGVSGATLAIITGIFERLVNAIKSLDAKAVKLLFRGRFRETGRYIDFNFLLAVFFGAAAAILTLARALEYLLLEHEIYVMAFFFGLILASVYFVGRTVKKWSVFKVFLFIAGTGFAVSLIFLNPAVENSNTFYLFVCGLTAISSMILPGISGSFILLLMGNYELIIKAINNLDLSVLVPFAAGCVIGLLAFAHILSWILKKFRDATLAVLTGFICGSLVTIWPWKKEIFSGFLTDRHGEPALIGYDRYIPSALSTDVILAALTAAAGIACIWALESYANKGKG